MLFANFYDVTFFKFQCLTKYYIVEYPKFFFQFSLWKNQVPLWFMYSIVCTTSSNHFNNILSIKYHIKLPFSCGLSKYRILHFKSSAKFLTAIWSKNVMCSIRHTDLALWWLWMAGVGLQTFQHARPCALAVGKVTEEHTVHWNSSWKVEFAHAAHDALHKRCNEANWTKLMTIIMVRARFLGPIHHFN